MVVSVKNLVVVAALAIAFVQKLALADGVLKKAARNALIEFEYKYGQVTPSSTFCERLRHGIETFEDQKDSEKVSKFIEAFKGGPKLRKPERKVLKVAVSIVNQDCSSRAWKNMLRISLCIPSPIVAHNPLKAYTAECLTPDYVQQKMKAALGDVAGSADFIDSEFIEKFRRDTTDSEPVDKFIRATVDAIRRDFARKNKDPKVLIYGKKGEDPSEEAGGRLNEKDDKLWQYLSEKLFKPCEHYRKRLESFFEEMKTICLHYDGGHEALVRRLNQATQDDFFRFQNCWRSDYRSYHLFKEVKAKLM